MLARLLSAPRSRRRDAERPVDGFPLDLAEFAVVDLETTGLFARAHDRVIEVGVVCVDADGEFLAEYETLVNPARDLGPTALHGVRARDVTEAPSFAEIAGDVAAHLDGCVVVAHNVRFERSFVEAEFARAGMPVPAFPALCTMSLADRFHVGARRLEDCCAALSIRHAGAHRALADARATAELLACLLKKAREAGIAHLAQLGCEPLPPPAWPVVAPSGRALRRSDTATRSRPESYLGRLVARLPQTHAAAGDEAALAYLDVLDRALEDRQVTPAEAGQLEALAREWGLDAERLRSLHRDYLEALVATALADGKVTEAERTDLDDVAALLGFESGTVETLIGGRGPGAQGRGWASCPPLRRDELRGLSVCFTGQMTSTFDGEPVTREAAQRLAREAGMDVRDSVTKSLDILVVADPDTMSGKARKARAYGTRIVAERAFWQALGVAVE